MNTTKTLLVLFVILTLILAAVSVFEYSQSSHSETLTLITTYTTTTTASLATQPLSNSGFIQILDGSTFKVFYYVQWNSTTPNTFTIINVKFTLWTNTTVTNTGGTCYGAAGNYGGYIITFPDGTTERMTTCTAGPNPPTALRLTTHVNPQAGLFIFPSTGAVYFLVSS
jgi:hypothetical protein